MGTSRRSSGKQAVPLKSTPAHLAADGRPVERVRIAHHAQASITTRRAAPDTSLEVDYMMLDYLAFQATGACLSHTATAPGSRQHEDSAMERSLALVDDCLAVFKNQHPGYRFDPQLRVRILLLKLVSLFNHRLSRSCNTPASHSLHSLRQRNQKRARLWIGRADRVPSAQFDPEPFDTDLPLAPEDLAINRAQVLHLLDIPAEDDAYEDDFYGTSACVSLLDLLPLFMEVSAICQSIYNSNASSQWMSLAAEWMLQACLEQYLVCGAQGTDAIDEAFAWGFKEKAVDAEDGKASSIDYDATRDMFDDEGVEVAEWQYIKNAVLAELFPSNAGGDEDQVDIAAHLEALATRTPIQASEQRFRKFLVEFASSALPEPVLAQLEKGKLDDMTVEETQAFLEGCGVS